MYLDVALLPEFHELAVTGAQDYGNHLGRAGTEIFPVFYQHSGRFSRVINISRTCFVSG